MMEQVQNISERTGVSKDYILAFGALDNYLRRIEKKEEPRWINLAKNALLHRSLLRYEEYFTKERYGDVINDKNHETVAQLNKIVDEINKIRESGQLDFEKLNSLWKEINGILSS